MSIKVNTGAGLGDALALLFCLLFVLCIIGEPDLLDAAIKRANGSACESPKP